MRGKKICIRNICLSAIVNYENNKEIRQNWCEKTFKKNLTYSFYSFLLIIISTRIFKVEE